MRLIIVIILLKLFGFTSHCFGLIIKKHIEIDYQEMSARNALVFFWGYANCLRQFSIIILLIFNYYTTNFQSSNSNHNNNNKLFISYPNISQVHTTAAVSFHIKVNIR